MSEGILAARGQLVLTNVQQLNTGVRDTNTAEVSTHTVAMATHPGTHRPAKNPLESITKGRHGVPITTIPI